MVSLGSRPHPKGWGFFVWGKSYYRPGRPWTGSFCFAWVRVVQVVRVEHGEPQVPDLLDFVLHSGATQISQSDELEVPEVPFHKVLTK